MRRMQTQTWLFPLVVTALLGCSGGRRARVGEEGGGAATVQSRTNLCPEIERLVVTPSATLLGGTISVAITATDAAPTIPLSFDWTATSGTFANPRAAATTFTCTSAGEALLTVRASDGECQSADILAVECLRAPQSRSCGNGIQEPGEDCDDGDTDENDGCRTNCTRPRFALPTACRACLALRCPRNTRSSATGAVTLDAKVRGCLDPALTADERRACDDAVLCSRTDGCALAPSGAGLPAPTIEAIACASSACAAACDLAAHECGNGILEGGEACDDGNTSGDDHCNATCTGPACGNGVLDGGEACDDGNSVDGDGCRNDCRAP